MKSRLGELAGLFLKLGTIGFGGPAAHISMMEEEVVTRRNWMSREHFLDLIGATNLIPGPNSTEMAIHVGYQRAGIAGLVVAGAAFVIPAVLLTGLLAWFYVAYGEVPQVAPFMAGIKPAVLAIIASAMWKLGQKALKNRYLALIGSLVVLAGLMGADPALAVLGGGLAGMLLLLLWQGKGQTHSKALLLLPLSATALAGAALAKPTAIAIFFAFLKIGSILFGSGYVLVAFLETDIVQKLGWLNNQQLLDAIAIGQFTPGPVLSTATFAGYLINGSWGALAATLGIFLPSFLFVLLLNPLIPRMRGSRLTGLFLDAVNVSALGLMVATTIKLAMVTVVDWQALLIVSLAAVAVFRFKAGPVVVVLAGSLAGFVLPLLFG